MSAFEPFEQFDEVEDIIDRLEDPDPGTRC